MPPAPARGEVWYADFSPTIGHEQAGLRPALVVSVDQLNQGPAAVVVVVPITRTDRRIPLHVRLDPPEGGLAQRSFAMSEQLRAISAGRLKDRRGIVSPKTMAEVEDRLKIVLGLR